MSKLNFLLVNILQNPQLGDSVERGLATIRSLMGSLQSPVGPLRAGVSGDCFVSLTLFPSPIYLFMMYTLQIPPEVCRQNIHATMAAILSSAASIITETTTGEPEDIDYIAVGTSVSVM